VGVGQTGEAIPAAVSPEPPRQPVLALHCTRACVRARARLCAWVRVLREGANARCDRVRSHVRDSGGASRTIELRCRTARVLYSAVLRLAPGVGAAVFMSDPSRPFFSHESPYYGYPAVRLVLRGTAR
jgi:hypothetical protein